MLAGLVRDVGVLKRYGLRCEPLQLMLLYEVEASEASPYETLLHEEHSDFGNVI